MPVELKNIKGGGLHYVAYLIDDSAISSPLKPNFSGLGSSITAPTRRDSSRVPVSHPTTISMTPSTTKEYADLHKGMHHPLPVQLQPILQLPLHVRRIQEMGGGPILGGFALPQWVQSDVVPSLGVLRL